MEELATSADRSHPPYVFVEIGKTEKSVDNAVTNYGSTLSMKHVSQHSTQRKTVFADKVDHRTYEMRNYNNDFAGDMINIICERFVFVYHFSCSLLLSEC